MNETERVYHGSKRGLTGAIRADRGNPAADFGAGFYMGTDIHQPQTLICGWSSPILYALDFDSAGLRAYEFQPGLDMRATMRSRATWPWTGCGKEQGVKLTERRSGGFCRRQGDEL